MTHSEPSDLTQGAPIDMVLHCPECGMQHIDEPWSPGQPLTNDQITGAERVWDNPPHRSHLCHGCGHIWRPCDLPTNGVREVRTRGKGDSPLRPGVDKRVLYVQRTSLEAALDRLINDYSPDAVLQARVLLATLKR